MSRRHRVTFQATPVWHPGPTTREPVDLSGPGPVPRPVRPAGRRRPLAIAIAVAVAAVVALAPLPEGGHERADPAPPTTTAPPGRDLDPTGRDAPRIFIEGPGLIAPPFEGSVNRYRPSDLDRGFVRAHTIRLRGADGAGALLVVDATRRADVHGAHAARSPVGVALRVLEGARGIRTLEWDRPGWGLSLTTSGVDVAEGLRVVDAVGVPVAASARSGAPPDLDAVILVGLGLDVTDHRGSPASGVGGPLVGQAGLDSIDAYLYRSEVGQPASLLLTGALGASVRAADLVSALGRDVLVDPPWRGSGLAVAFDLTTEAPVGYRITGERRVVFDHPSGITYWLTSDQLSLADLLAAGASIDFDRIARGLTRT